MSAKSPQKTPATNQLRDWLDCATGILSDAAIPSARLDSEVLLAHLLNRRRTYLHAHDDILLSDSQITAYQAMIQLRASFVPVAYITRHKEFYGRHFFVTPDVLVPRPESEDIIDRIKELAPFTRLLDIGCGSGALGITAKLELPNTNVVLSDVSPAALAVARRNAQKLGATVQCIESDLLLDSSFDNQQFDTIIANLPYVDRAWPTGPEIQYEPSLALFADNSGLALIQRLLSQAPQHLASGGHLLLEADPEQHPAIITQAKENGLRYLQTIHYIVELCKD